MKKGLIKRKKELYYYKDGNRIEGANPDLIGNCSGLSGDCSGLSGDCTWLKGSCSGLSGNCSNLSGDLDDCELTEEERKKGINIKDLVSKE